MDKRLQEIPAGSIEVQTGLWAYWREFTVGNTVYGRYILYSAAGYCFYLPANNLDEDGNLKPENERVYYQYLASGYRTVEQVNANVVSVPVQDGYEIVSVGGNHETA